MDMKNKDLLDWQLGNESKTSPLDRVDLMNAWLKKNKLDVIKGTREIKPSITPVGFDKLPMF